MKRLFLSILLVSMLANHASAQSIMMINTLPPATSDNEVEAKNDTLVVPELTPPLDTAMFMLDWNTRVTHLDSIDLSTREDSVHLNLSTDFHPHFAIPFAGTVRDSFRWRRSRHHNGVDVKLNTGDTVFAAFDGKVRYAQYNTGGYGNLVIIRHYNDLETYYGHFSKLLVDTNQIVKAGEPIGLGGSTGRSTGPHLHFEVRYLGNPIDPEEIIDWECSSLQQSDFIVHKDLFKHIREMRQRAYYRVRKGDSLSRIAGKYHTSVRSICRLNGIRSTSIIRIGQRLRVR